jgi:hypothetical protein
LKEETVAVLGEAREVLPAVIEIQEQFANLRTLFTAEFGAIERRPGHDHDVLEETAKKLDEARAQLLDLSGEAELRLYHRKESRTSRVTTEMEEID